MGFDHNDDVDFDKENLNETNEIVSEVVTEEDVVLPPVNLDLPDTGAILTVTDDLVAATTETKDSKTEQTESASDTEIVENTNTETDENINTEAVENTNAEADQNDEFNDLPVIDMSFLGEEEMPVEEEIDDESLNNISNHLASQVEQDIPAPKENKKQRLIWPYVLIGLAGVFILSVVLLLFTDKGKNFLISKGLGVLFGANTNYEEVIVPENTPSVTPGNENVSDSTAPDSTQPVITNDVERYHILVLGLDAEDEEDGTVTDLIMMATLDPNADKVTFTGFLRDMYVATANVKGNTLRNIYSEQGVAGLYSVAESFTGVKPDGYILFEYDSFKSVIDSVGGISIKLSEEEAEYLNSSNFIVEEENRILKDGNNRLNGDQALGYCRIQAINDEEKTNGEQLRINRCVKLMKAFADQCKKMGITESADVFKKCCENLTTDITGDEFAKYVNCLLEMEKISYRQYQIPAVGTFNVDTMKGKTVLLPEVNKNREKWENEVNPPIVSNDSSDSQKK